MEFSIPVEWLERIERKIDAQGRMLEAQGKALESHGRMLEARSVTLQAHSKIIEKHGEELLCAGGRASFGTCPFDVALVRGRGLAKS